MRSRSMPAASRPARADSRRARRLRHRPHVAAAAAARPARPQRGAVRRRRADRHDARAVPEVAARVVAVPRAVAARSPATASTGRASRSPPRSRSSTQARGTTGGPATFLLDEFLELRTFESFPGLRTVLRDLIARAGVSANRFVLTSRYTARAQRLLRDAPARFEIMPVDAAERRRSPRDAAAAASTAAPRASRTKTRSTRGTSWRRLVHALSDGRPAYARMIAEAATALGAARRGRSGQRAVRAARARRAALRGLPLLLRAAPAPRARLRRAQGHPRRAGGRRAADADRDRAAPAPHAGLDQGLSVVARGRRPDRVAAEALQLRRSAAAPLGAPPLPADAARPTKTSPAKCTATCMGRLPHDRARARAGRRSAAPRAGEKSWGIIEID